MKLEENLAPGNLPIHIVQFLRKAAIKVNGLASGRYSAKDNAASAAPTTGTWVKGDIVWNSNPTEAGGAGNKYVVLGFVCVTSGTPGTWVQVRTLTGN